MKKLVIIIVFLNFLFISTSFSINYYVSKTGSDSNPGTLAQPWLTIQKAANNAHEGDSVLIMRGTYNESVQVKNSGAAGRPIVFTSFEIDSESHVGVGSIDGTDITGNFSGLFEMINKNFINVENISVSNSSVAGIYIENCSNITVSKTSTYRNQSSGIGAWNSKNIKILLNKVGSNCLGLTQECLTVAICDSFEIKGNEVYGCSKEGLDAKDGSSNGTIDGNIVHDINGHLGIYIDSWDKHLFNITVKNNLVSNCDEGIVLASEMGGLCENIHLFNNVVYNNKFIGINVSYNGDDSTVKVHPIKDVFIINNTSFKNGYTWGGGIACGNEDASNIIIRNNICSDNLSFQIAHEGIDSTITKIDHNLINGFRDYPGEERGKDFVEGDPMFVDTSSFYIYYDLRLQTGSPAIDKGTPDLAPSTDFYNYTRPQGTGFDIGAFEYIPDTGVEDNKQVTEYQNFNVYYDIKSDKISISNTLVATEKINIKIFNLAGVQLFSVNDLSFEGSYDLSASALYNGIYFCLIQSGSSVIMKKFVVMR